MAGPALSEAQLSALAREVDEQLQTLRAAEPETGVRGDMGLPAKQLQSEPQLLCESACAVQPLDDPGPPAPLDDATFSARLRHAVSFVRSTTIGLRVWGTPGTVPFRSNVANNVGTPWSFRNSGVDAAGAVDIYYSTGSWDLDADASLRL